MLNQLKKELQKAGDKKKAEVCARFFKTGKGEYGEGDIFLGVAVPKQRKIAKKYADLRIGDLRKLLSSKIHNYRSIALFILISQYEKADAKGKKKIFDFYLKNIKNVNNWDLVDCSAPHITGDYLLNKNRRILYKLAKSKNLWKRRIAILATYRFIKKNQFKDALKISETLLNDEHDLIHKAVGWMLREIGNRDKNIEEKFLKKYYRKMPRTMLRYAIEKFDEKKRILYLKNKI
ncbi:MAG: DNA alkylation repair protein [Patescibacteria group bacterium]|nr:DNA alkylation repair protein [Patescibacteria group bacterium]